MTLFHGTHRPGPVTVPATSAEDREILRLAAWWATSDPDEAHRYGPHLQTVRDRALSPYQITLEPTPGDPGAEIAEAVIGAGVWEADELDIAALLAARGHDAVQITWTDGRRWLAVLHPAAAHITS